MALEDEPTGGFGEFENEDEDGSCEDDLEGDGEAPGYGVGVQVVEAKIDPVGNTYSASNHGPWKHVE